MAETEPMSAANSDAPVTTLNLTQKLEDLRKKEKLLLKELGDENRTIEDLEKDYKELSEAELKAQDQVEELRERVQANDLSLQEMVEKEAKLSKALKACTSKERAAIEEELRIVSEAIAEIGAYTDQTEQELSTLTRELRKRLEPKEQDIRHAILEEKQQKRNIQAALQDAVINRRSLETLLGIPNEGDQPIPGLEDFPLESGDWKESRRSAVQQMSLIQGMEEVNVAEDAPEIRGFIISKTIIGETAWATLYKGQNVFDNKEVTVKMFKMDELGDGYLQHLKRNTIKILWHLNNEVNDDVVMIYDWFLLNGKTSVMVEQFLMYQLAYVMTYRGSLKESELKKYARGLANAVNYLHGSGIAHQNISACNVYLTPENVIKLSAFEYAVICWDAENDKLIPQSLTYDINPGKYVAPEVKRNNEYDPTKADIYSYGTMLYYMAIGRYPYELEKQGTREEQMMESAESFSKVLSERAVDLQEKCLKSNPEERLDIRYIVRHPWFLAV